MPLIDCVEDDESIRELVGYALRGQGYRVEGFGSAAAFYQALPENPPDLVLLDIMLPGEDGLTVLRKLRASARWKDLPVILMTAKTSEFDIVKGLDMGADDYVKKPFGIMELISRIRSVLRRARRAETQEQEQLSFDGITVDRKQHTASVEGREVALTLKEFDLLWYLVLNKGIVLTRDQIMQAVWDSPFGMESRTIDMHIMSLRQKLGDKGKLIHTVRGVGYRLGKRNG